METARRHDIDWLRVIAIGLLLIYHIAIVFQPWALFIGFIRSDELLEGLWKPMSLINVWRIPFLFFVSGMGVYFAMQKRNIKQLLLDRSKRILVPYLFGIVAIVPLHFFLFQNYYNQPLNYFAHPAHLWFLGNIVIYISILFPFFFQLIKKPEGRFRRSLEKMMRSPLGPLAILPFFILEVLIVQPDIFTLYAQTLHGYAIGFLAFFFGFLMVYIGKSFWQILLKWHGLYLALALGMGLLRISILEAYFSNALMAVESNLWILGIFGLGYKYLNRPSKSLSYLSESAYPIYIIHMFVLYAVASWVLKLSLDPYLKFALSVLLTLAGCLLIFELIIKRIPLLRPLFGMKYRRVQKTK